MAYESQNYPDLAALSVLWDRLPESGRNLLRQTVEMLAGALPQRGRKGKAK